MVPRVYNLKTRVTPRVGQRFPWDDNLFSQILARKGPIFKKRQATICGKDTGSSAAKQVFVCMARPFEYHNT